MGEELPVLLPLHALPLHRLLLYNPPLLDILQGDSDFQAEAWEFNQPFGPDANLDGLHGVLLHFGGFHVYLVLSNQATIEFQTNFIRRAEARRNREYFRNPYDLGRTRNFQQVFGPYLPRSLRWLLSWLTQPPSGDGIRYPSLSRL